MSGNLILGVLRLEPNFLLLRLEIDLNLGFVTGTWVGLETDGLGGSAGAGLGWAGLEGGGAGAGVLRLEPDFC